MKTQILHLEVYDDRHSISDKLDWGRADRAILIWPLRGQPLSNKLDLNLIQRRCQTAGMKLALVCRDPSIKEYALGLDIPVFRSLRKAQQVAWEYSLPPEDALADYQPERKLTRQELKQQITPTQETNWMELPQARISAVVISLLALLTMVIFLVPSAQITYLPKLETQSLQLEILADPKISAFNLSGTLPVENVTVSVEGRSELDVSGELGIPFQSASGLIEFTNITNRALTIPTGTEIRTTDPASTIRFITSTAASLPGEVGAAVSVPIEAVNPGSNSNLPENTLVVVDGELSLSLTAVNPQPTSGGTEQLSAAPTLEDYDLLHDQLITSLQENALAELETTNAALDIILFNQPAHITISEETYLPEQPQPTDSLSLLLRVDFDVYVIRWETFQAMGNAILDATLAEEFTSQPDTFSMSQVSDPILGADDTSTWEVIIFRQVFASRDLPEALKMITGKSTDQASLILTDELDLAADPDIIISPSWWPWLPLLGTRITLNDIWVSP
ncbi:MAG: baseplate J/gp47 family protein [Chloroflexota bacterium]